MLDPYDFLKDTFADWKSKSILDIGFGLGSSSHQTIYLRNNLKISGLPTDIDCVPSEFISHESSIWLKIKDIENITNWMGIDIDDNFDKIKKFISSLRQHNMDSSELEHCFNWISRNLNRKIHILDASDMNLLKNNIKDRKSDYIILNWILHFNTFKHIRIDLINYLYSTLNINGIIYLRNYKQSHPKYTDNYSEFSEKELLEIKKFGHIDNSTENEDILILKYNPQNPYLDQTLL